ncbi:MAG: Crp/Fnr family transcriptional regulator [Dehalococcoidia bacterium]|nr:Crp/Fnr family transcriptional regulator [Dehalococcoidia bacterium]MDH4299442.1 Crp/Fnr family transcriptional regulator [Dehalococcoidia bacterium]MDH4366615.1 Crp/Fnr family transcriptional regulator [Dehalococcoidia bacterium]
MTVQLDFLKNVLYFSGLDLAEIESIDKLVFEKSAERGEMVLLEGESATDLYFVASGAVKVFKTSAEGKEQILSIVRPGESFNDVSIFDGGPNPASARAMGPVLLYGIKKNDIEAILRNHPRVVLNVINVLASRVRHLVSLVEDLSFKHVIGRVAKILFEQVGGGQMGRGPRLTQQEMAAMAGTAREVVGRSLKALEEEGAIKVDRNRIVITDKEALKRVMEVSS